jgi:hypothetical protein
MALTLRKVPIEGSVEERGMKADELFMNVEGFFFKFIGDDYRNNLLSLSAIIS